MATNDELLALADELEAVSLKDDCESCLAFGTGLCRGDLECAESAHKACAKRLREIVEHDACEVTTVSAYDLLPEEDRKALAWVRGYGGLEAVKASIHQGAMGHGCLLKVAEMLGTSIYDGTDNADALIDKLEKRIIPEGMEWLLEVWPKWSNGEYCKFGDWWTAAKYGYYEPKQLRRLGFYTPGQLKEWEQDEGDNYGYEWNFMRPSDTNYRPDKAETPASKVLAADGEPLEVGQTVYAPHYGYAKCTVLAIEWVVDGYLVEVENEGGHKFRQTPDEFTHQRPVLDADGVPIREGDEVWEVRSHRRREIVGTHYRDYETGEPLILCDGDDAVPIPATCVTHAKPEPPDSWERIEKDAEKTVCEYFGANYDCANCPLESARCAEEVKKDIIRRAKKLAERGEL